MRLPCPLPDGLLVTQNSKFFSSSFNKSEASARFFLYQTAFG